MGKTKDQKGVGAVSPPQIANITTELVTKSNTLVQLHAEANDWTGKNYQMFDDGGVEVEVGEFLYSLVRVTKAQNILETGTYTGISAMYMAQACKDNGAGLVESVEYEAVHKQRAEELWKRVGVATHALCVLQDTRTFKPAGDYDLIFLDSEPHLRFAELVRFFPYLRSGGYIFLHDLHRHMGQGQPENPDHPDVPNWPWGALPEQVVQWVQEDQLRPMHFPTPRGFMGFYKPTKEDFLWNSSQQ